MQNGIYAIVACADRRQLPAACVALLTARRHVKGEVRLYVVGQDCQPEDVDGLGIFCAANDVAIEFINFTSDINVGMGNLPPDTSTAYYLRLHLDQLLPSDLARVLYIDADTLTIGNITRLFTMDMGENFLAASPDVYIQTRVLDHLPKLLDVRKNGYFSSGVLVFDWQKTLHNDFINRTRAFAATKPELPLNDQDCLNHLAQGEWLRLSPDYNAIIHYQSAGNNVIIAHFAGREKPWLPNYYLRQVRYRTIYKQALGSTPWRNFIQPKTLIGWLVVVWEPVMWWRQRRVGKEWQLLHLAKSP